MEAGENGHPGSKPASLSVLRMILRCGFIRLMFDLLDLGFFLSSSQFCDLGFYPLWGFFLHSRKLFSLTYLFSMHARSELGNLNIGLR